ncbi:MAG: ice-binding family protein [Candidatus Methylomirabilia bacterium]
MIGFAALLYGPSPAAAQSAGQAASFAIVGGQGVNANGSGSSVNGDVGVTAAAGTAITGFPANAAIVPPFANHGNDASAIAAGVDVLTLYNSGAMAPGVPNTPASLNLGGPGSNGIYPPGTYTVGVGVADLPAGTSMTLNGNGLYIFTVNSALTTAVTSTINFAGVDPCNVWWRVPTQATINNPNFPGNVVSNAGVALGTSVHLYGRALTTANGLVTLAGDDTVDTCSDQVPPSPVPTLPKLAILALMAFLAAAGFAAMRWRTE